MTLLEAFQSLGPCLGDPQLDAARERAAEVILAALQQVARGMRGVQEDLEDATMDALQRITRQGPRGVRRGDPGTDDEVRYWLARALVNNHRDVIARRRRCEPFLDDRGGERQAGAEALHDRARGVEGAMVSRLDTERVRVQRERVYEDIDTHLADNLRPEFRDGILRAVGELRRMAEGEHSFDDIVRSLHAQPGRTERNRVHQNHCRARRRVLEYVRGELQQPGLPPYRAAALRLVAQDMQARAPRAGAGRSPAEHQS